MVFSLVLAASILLGAFAYADVTRDLPSVEILPRLLNPPDGLLLQPTRIYDRTGLHPLFTFASAPDAPRRYIPINEQNPQHIPASLVNAVLAVAVLAIPAYEALLIVWARSRTSTHRLALVLGLALAGALGFAAVLVAAALAAGYLPARRAITIDPRWPCGPGREIGYTLAQTVSRSPPARAGMRPQYHTPPRARLSRRHGG